MAEEDIANTLKREWTDFINKSDVKTQIAITDDDGTERKISASLWKTYYLNYKMMLKKHMKMLELNQKI